MKVGLIFCAIILFSSQSLAAPSSSVGELEHCRNIYNAVIGHITSSEGEESTDAIWKLLFHDIDIDSDGKLTSSDIALYLGKENFVHETDVFELIGEAAEWIKVGDDGDGQLTVEEFDKVVLNTIAMKQEAASSAIYSEISLSLCHLFTNKVPHIAETMVELETCAKHLEESLLTDNTRRAEFNSWTAIFDTLDINKDKKIDFEEIKHAVGHSLTADDDISLANALGHAIYGTVHHDVKDLNEQGFYVFVHELLYGVAGTDRKHYWADVTTEHELRGRSMLCHVIREVRTQLTGQRDVMNDCIHSYQATRQKILGEDGVFAPEIVFTMVDVDKDGTVSREEFDAFTGSQSTLYNVIERKHAAKEMKIDEFRAVMPDEIVEAKMKNDVDAVLELTSMTASELHDAEKLCSAIISSVQHYQASALAPHVEETEHEGEHVFIPMNFKGSGEYIFQEHTLPPPEEESAPTEAPNPEVMHLTDQHGNPFEISVQHPVVEESHEEEPHPNTETEEHQPFPETDSWHGIGDYQWVEHTLPHDGDVSTTTHDTLITPPPPSRPSEDDKGIVYHMVDADGNPIEVHLTQVEIDDIMHRIAMAQVPTPVEPTGDTEHNTQGQVPEQEVDTDAEHSQIVQEIERILKARENEDTSATTVPPTPSTASPSSENEEEEELRELLEDLENARKHHQD